MMYGKALGKHYRKGMTLDQLMSKFPHDRTAEIWFEESDGGMRENPIIVRFAVATGRSDLFHLTDRFRISADIAAVISVSEAEP